MVAAGGIKIRRAGSADAAAMAGFAAGTFREAFGAHNTPADMAAYTADAFSEAIQRAEIEHPDIDTLLALNVDAIVGYVQLWREPPPACVNGRRPIEIRRLYVGSNWRGTGLAGRLMSAAAAVAAELAADTVWLGVWERNARAQVFYRKLGFRPVGTQAFVLGSDHQTDCIFSAPLRRLNEAVSTCKDSP